MLENARDSLPYMQDADITFKDSNGNQAVFEFHMDNNGYLPVHYIMETSCELYPDTKITVRATGDEYYYILKERTSLIDIDIYVRLSTQFHRNPIIGGDYKVFDEMFLKFLYNSDFHSAMAIIINQREIEEEYIHVFESAQPEVTLLDKTFYHVYTNNTHPEYNDIWYNTEFGIVGFEDTTGKLWVFESMTPLK